MATRGVNKVILIGNVGQEPEVRVMPNSNNSVCNLSIATGDSWRDRNSGETQERTEWHRVVMFNRLAEVARDYLKKGSKVYLEGSLRTKKWQDNNGQTRYTTEINATEMVMLDRRGEAGGDQPQAMGQSAPAYAAPAQAAPTGAEPQATTFEDDDIPF